MKKNRFARLGLMAATMAAVAVGVVASPASAASATCESWGGNVCTSGSIPANGDHQVCFGGTHKALSYWGRAELWDADTGVMVGSIATNPYRYQQTCVGGLYGQRYYERGTGGDFKGDVWND
ncbi:hypothetical protein AB0F11_01990 [Streptomyces sp. NPDC032472]|uniref:hypothetical protein n=1 Tax=Streptomyces sp. NPDC032472 TaxID=3155018 RepID=UPI0033FFE432